MTPKQLLAKAASYLNAGEPLPIDLYISLTSAGIDAAELEAKWVRPTNDDCGIADCGMCAHGFCKSCTTDCLECQMTLLG